MYNTISRGRLASASSARLHMGMRARAPSTTASQVTLSQAMDIFDDDDVIPETELIDDVNPSVMVDEAAQPPPLSPIPPPSGLANIEHRIAPVLCPADLIQDPGQPSDLILAPARSIPSSSNKKNMGFRDALLNTIGSCGNRTGFICNIHG